MAGTGPLMLDQLNRVIQHNIGLEPGEEPTGEIHRDSAGQTFQVIRTPKTVYGKRPRRGPDNEVIWHTDPAGNKLRPQLESYVVETTYDEYIKFPLGNGITQKVRNFRPTPEEQERIRMSKENQQSQAELRELLAASGKTFQDIVEAVKSKAGVQPRPAPTPPQQPVSEPDADTTTFQQPDAEPPKPPTGIKAFHAMKRQAELLDLDVKGTGKNGAVTKDDLERAFAEAGVAPTV